MPDLYSIPVKLLTSLLGLVLCGCVGMSEPAYPGKKARQAVEQGQSFVFFGFDDGVAEKDIEMRPGMSSKRFNAVNYALVNLETGEEYSATRGLTSFTGPEEDEKWSGVTVPPGTYFLHIIPPFFTAEGVRWDWRANRYLLRVSQGGTAVYAGTLAPECDTEKPFLMGTTFVDCDPNVPIRDDAPRARIAIANWPDAPPELVVDLPEPLLAPVPEGAIDRAQSAILHVTGPGQPVAYPHWRRFDNETEPERENFLSAGIRSMLYPEGGGMGNGCYGGGCIALALLVGAVVAVDEAGKAVDAANEKSEWAACFDTVRDHAAAYPVERRTADEWAELMSAVGETRIAAADTANRVAADLPATLTLDVYRMALRKCQGKETVCAEMALRARLGRPGEAPEFERMYAYSAEEFDAVAVESPHRFAEMPAHPWWEEATEQYSAPHHVTDFCGEDGEEALAGEFDRGVAALLDKLKSDLEIANKVAPAY